MNPPLRSQYVRPSLRRWAALIGSALVVAAYVGGRSHHLGRNLQAAQAESATLEHRLAVAQARLAAARERVHTMDTENQRLIDAIAAGAIPPTGPPRLTREALGARVRRGQAAEAAGDEAGAWAEYSACYDVGFRSRELVPGLVRLSRVFPPAREGLDDRRQRAEARVLSHPDDVETMSDLIALNSALGETARTLALYDRLPSPALRQLQGTRGMLEVFIQARRYPDALRVLPYDYLQQGLDRLNPSDGKQAARETAQRAIIAAGAGTEEQKQQRLLALQRGREAQRQATITESAVGVEILAGAGELPHAREIARGVLALHRSAATRALLEKHAARAGHAELLRDL